MKRVIFIASLFVFISTILSRELPRYAPHQAIIRIQSYAYQDLTYEQQNRPFVSISNSELTEAFSELRVWKIERLLPTEENTSFGIRTGMNRSFVIYFDSDKPIDQVISQLRLNPAIGYAMPNYLYIANVIPDDPHYNSQWALPKINMPDAWDIQKGNANIRIAILDVGFKLDHEDLFEKFSLAYERDETDIDISAYLNEGYTLIAGEDYIESDDDPTGKGTHGTHVAGIAAATTNNNEGVAGVGWNTILVPVRCGFQIIHPSFGSIGLLESDDWVRALNWVRNNSAARVLICNTTSLELNGDNSTSRVFSLPQAEPVILEIYDITGRKIRTLVKQFVEAGYHVVSWDSENDLGEQVSSGVYIYQIKAGNFIASRKMMLLR